MKLNSNSNKNIVYQKHFQVFVANKSWDKTCSVLIFFQTIYSKSLFKQPNVKGKVREKQ